MRAVVYEEQFDLHEETPEFFACAIKMKRIYVHSSRDEIWAPLDRDIHNEILREQPLAGSFTVEIEVSVDEN